MKKFEQDFLTDYSDGALIEEIRRVAKLITTGPLTRRNFGNLASVSHSTVSHRFGGWYRALAAAGVADRYSGVAVTSKMRNQRGKKMSQEETLHEIRRVVATLGEKPLTTSEFNRLSSVSVKTVRRAFGSLDRGVALAGLPSRVDAQREVTRDRYLALLKSASQKLNGTAPSLAGFDNLHLGVSARTIRRFFDFSWSKALQTAGLQPKRTWKEPFTEEECLENLDRVWAALGRQPLYDELCQPPSQIGPKAYERIWGTVSRGSWRMRSG